MAENHTQSSDQCTQSRVFLLMTNSFLAVKTIIILPLAVVVLHLGYRHWRQQRSAAPTSHTDVLAYHMAVLDLLFVVAVLLSLCGELSGLLLLTTVSYHIYAFTFPGPVLLHILTCLERYLAVVHPVTYLKLRRSGGSRIWNGFLVCTWLLSLGWGAGGRAALNPPYFPMFILLAFALVTVTLSSLRVLVVLIRPKPGEGGRANQSRLRAFQTMAVITGLVWMWFLGSLVTLALGKNISKVVSCVVVGAGFWFTVPSHLVLPLLFLHRAGKLTACKGATNNNTN